MIGGWWQARRRRQEARAVARRSIPDALWQHTLARYPFLQRLSAEDMTELRRLASLFLDKKEFTGAGGLVVTDEMAVAVAAQACLPVLRLGIEQYDDFVGIVMHPDEVVARREVMDETGVVHQYDELLAGEAMVGGPMMLSWQDAGDRAADAEDRDGLAYNVVIHEFAHVLDMRDGVADGVPLLPNARAQADWHDTLMAEYDRFSERVVCGYDTVVDPYGAEAPEEFFAVASEAFFVTPEALKEEQPVMYRLLASFYRQTP